MSNDKITEAYSEALESADFIPMTSEELFRLGWQAALTQQPESQPGRTQRSKLEFLAARDDYVSHRDEFVIRVSFAGYKHCYLDRFGRVLWLNGVAEAAAQKPESEPVSTTTHCNSLNEHGPYFSLSDWEKLRELPPGTELYLGPQPTTQVPPCNTLSNSRAPKPGEGIPEIVGRQNIAPQVPEELESLRAENAELKEWVRQYAAVSAKYTGNPCNCMSAAGELHAQYCPVWVRDKAKSSISNETTLKAAPSIAEKLEWVSCVDRLPTAEDADSYGSVWWACFYPDDESPWLLARESWTTPDDAAYWMPTGLKRPEPPVSGGE